MAWLGSWTWAPPLGVLLTFLFLLFPDGRLPSRRWRPVAWLAAAATAGITMAFAFGQRTLEGYPGIPNPFGLPGATALEAAFLLLPPVSLAASVSLLLRFRRATGEARQQLNRNLLRGRLADVRAGRRRRLGPAELAGGRRDAGRGRRVPPGPRPHPARGRPPLHRRRYDAAKTIEAFSARLRDELDLDSLEAELLAVVDQTMEPTRASLWLRPRVERPARPIGR